MAVIFLASTGKEPEKPEETTDETLLIDVEEISLRTESALALKLETPTRQELYSSMSTMVGHLNKLLCQDLGAEGDEGARALIRRGYTLIDPTSRPGPQALTFVLLDHLRDIALVTRQLLWIYTQRNGVKAP